MPDTSKLGLRADAVLIAVEDMFKNNWKLFPKMSNESKQAVICTTWEAILNECHIPWFEDDPD